MHTYDLLIVKGSVRFSSFNLADLSLLHLTVVTTRSQLLETNPLISVISASLALGLFLLSLSQPLFLSSCYILVSSQGSSSAHCFSP